MQNKKTVFVLLDGLASNYTKEHLGYLEHLCENNKAAKYEVLGELPSASRPMYETIFTGKPVYEHGITNNEICRLSNQEHLFHLLHQQDRKSLVLGYYWLSELYISAPFEKSVDIYHDDGNADITKGFFYYDDAFPDSHLYSLASSLMCNEYYDFVVIHPMGIDDAGHKYGAASKEYAEAVIENDKLLSSYIPTWMQQGYSIVVASDHGMSDTGYHGGKSDLQRNTALYIIDQAVIGGYHTKKLSTLDIAPLLCTLLGVQKTQKMKLLEVKFKNENENNA